MSVICIWANCGVYPPAPKQLKHFHQTKFYDRYKFQSVEIYDGVESKILDDPVSIKKIIESVDTIIGQNMYFHLNVVMSYLCRMGHEANADNLKLCCTVDLHHVTNTDFIPRNSVYEIWDDYKKLSTHKNVRSPLVIDRHWVIEGEIIKTEISGKWLIFVNKNQLPKLWDFIKKNYKALGSNGAKSSTLSVNMWGGQPTIGVIILRFPDSKIAINKKRLINERLRKICTLRNLQYKTDEKSEKLDTVIYK